jgi:hypothetical protein
MSCLYLIQNDTHLKNFKGLITDADCFIDIGRLISQELSINEIKFGKELHLKGEGSRFYFLNFIQRIIFLITFKRNNQQALSQLNFDKVIIGNDGAIQRLIIDSLPNKNIPVEMWLDGIVSLKSSYYRNGIKIILGKFAALFSCSYFFPSVIGFYERIVYLNVMDDSVKAEYLRYKSFINIDNINVTLFPRHKYLVDLANEFKTKNVKKAKKRVLYLTSAWLFHNHKKEHKYQLSHVKELLRLSKTNESYEFKIRVHPREDKSDYSFVPSNNMSLLESFEDDLCLADCVISARSTGLFEADKIGKPVIVYNEFFEQKMLNDFLNSLDFANSSTELINFLKVKLNE